MDIGGVFKSGAFLLVIVLCAKTFHYFTTVGYQKAYSQSVHQCKLKLYNLFLANRLNVLYEIGQGESLEKINDDFLKAAEKKVEMLPSFWAGIVTTAAYTLFIGLNSSASVFILLSISLLQLFPPLIVKKRLQINYDDCREIEAQLTDFTVEAYRGFSTIKMYQLKNWWMHRLRKLHQRYEKIGKTSIYANQGQMAMEKFLDNIMQYGTYGLIGLIVLFGYETIETGVQVIALSAGLYGAVRGIFSSALNFSIARMAEKRISELLRSSSEEGLEVNNSEITLCNVDYSYNDKTIFKNANTTFNGDALTVIKGENGIGKSTLFQLIVGLLECKNGSVTIGGVAPSLLSSENFPKNICYLPQNDLDTALTAQELYQMIVPDRYEDAVALCKELQLSKQQICTAKINELSGGERKKVFLAFAFTVNPRFLLLDEPTNSLDEHGKRKLHELLKKRHGGALIITHDAIFDDLATNSFKISKGGIYREY